MNIFQFRHPQERVALSVSLLMSFLLVFLFPIPVILFLFLYVITVYAWQNWLLKQGLQVEFDEDSALGSARLQFAQKLKLGFIPAVIKLDPDHWDHRLAMLALRGRFIFFFSSPSEEMNSQNQMQLAWKMSEVAGEYGAWWHNLATFLPRLIPIFGGYLARAEILTIDRLTKYAMEDEPFTAEDLPVAPAYHQQQRGIFFYALADAWKEGALPWLVKYLGALFSKWPQPEQRKNLLLVFDPATIPEKITIESSPVSNSDFSTSDILPTQSNTYSSMANSNKINPALTTIIGLIAGIPLSYFFQSENLRGKLSMGDYITKLPDLFERAMRDDSYWSIFVTLGISVVIFGLIGYGAAYLLNRK